MAKIMIGAGLMRSAAQEEALSRAARDLPSDCNVEVFGSRATGYFTVTVKGCGLDAFKTFAPGDSDAAVTYLESLRGPQGQ